MADGFTACGGRVFISDVDAAALAASGHDGMIADAGEAAAMEAFVDGAVTRLGGLDVLVNNAGIAGQPPRSSASHQPNLKRRCGSISRRCFTAPGARCRPCVLRGAARS